MDLKRIFDKAEGGVLTYDQLMEGIAEGKGKFVDLSEGKYVDKQKYTDDLAARDTRISTLNDTIKTRDADLASLRTQLETAGTDSEALNKLTADFKDLQSKYDKETKDYQKKLEAQEYQFAVTEFANSKKFTSQAAKRDFVSSLLAKNLSVENGTIIGATDFVESYAKDNADAFVVEKQDPDPTPDPKPHFSGPTQPNGGPDTEVDAIPFNFTGVRAHED